VTQVQTAQQQAVSVQILQAGSQLAGVSAPAGPGAALQSAGAITQIQIGCVTQCFDVSSSNPVTVATAQQILAELGSLLEPPDPPSATPVPGSEQSIISQTSCQLQDGQSSSLSQAQSASESSTTVQLIEGTLPSVIESSLGGSAPGVEAVSQTLQGTWQLQIGCLFYCTASAQVQDATESSTTVENVSGQPAGSAGGLEATVTQVIWQVQVGCIAWCYGTTQVQQESTQSTVVVIDAPPPPSTPDPEPVSDSGTSAPAPAAGSSDAPTAPADPPPASPPASGPPVLPERLSFPTVVGQSALAMVGTLRGPAAASRAAVVTQRVPLTPSEPAPRLRSSGASVTVAATNHGTATYRGRVVDPAGAIEHSEHAARERVLEARAGEPGCPTASVILGLLAAALAFATFFTRAETRPDR
jgi:hypothetical protein